MEKNIAVLVSEGSLYAKVDRPANQVAFAKPKVSKASQAHGAAASLHAYTSSSSISWISVSTLIHTQAAEETLSDWASDVSELLYLVERTTHLINKEQMVHKIV